MKIAIKSRALAISALLFLVPIICNLTIAGENESKSSEESIYPIVYSHRESMSFIILESKSECKIENTGSNLSGKYTIKNNKLVFSAKVLNEKKSFEYEMTPEGFMGYGKSYIKDDEMLKVHIKGKNRAQCIINRRNIQQMVRGHLNLNPNSVKIGGPLNWNDLKDYMPIPECPTHGAYKLGKVYPVEGKLAAECTNPEHDFDHSGW